MLLFLHVNYSHVETIYYIILFIFQSLATAKFNGVQHIKLKDIKQI